jgi:hypothetical protein
MPLRGRYTEKMEACCHTQGVNLDFSPSWVIGATQDAKSLTVRPSWMRETVPMGGLRVAASAETTPILSETVTERYLHDAQ